MVIEALVGLLIEDVENLTKVAISNLEGVVAESKGLLQAEAILKGLVPESPISLVCACLLSYVVGDFGELPIGGSVEAVIVDGQALQGLGLHIRA